VVLGENTIFSCPLALLKVSCEHPPLRSASLLEGGVRDFYSALVEMFYTGLGSRISRVQRVALSGGAPAVYVSISINLGAFSILPLGGDMVQFWTGVWEVPSSDTFTRPLSRYHLALGKAIGVRG
jgi:hypothetical protein